MQPTDQNERARRERREAYRLGGIRAWEEYKTGLHAPAAAAEAWLAELESGQDVEPLQCHARCGN
jgi:hypothetical protein